MSQRRLLYISLTLGLLTALLVFAYVKAAVRPESEGARESVTVVVAQREIRAKTPLTAGDLIMHTLPRAQANPKALQSIDDAVGRLTKDGIAAGEQVLESSLYAKDEKPGLTFAIPAGKRAVSVAVNEVIGVAGFVKPGDRVDVLGTFDEQVVGKTVTVTVLQDVEVLAISQRMEDEDPDAQVATTATLALTLDEAEKVTLAEERGKLRLALRPAGQSGSEYVTQVTASQMVRDRKGKSLEQIVPGAKPPVSGSAAPAGVSSASSSSPNTPPAPSAKVLVQTADGSWPVELYRGVEREVVKLDETTSR